MFGIFVDTSFKLFIDAPQRDLDPSSRSAHGQNLFRPYILTGNMDALANSSTVDWKDKKYMRSLGRPLWSSVHSDPFGLAGKKLIKKGDEDPNVLAVFLARVGLYLNQVHVGTGELVANHMATLLVSDARRTGLLVSYVSDPVLSEGMRRYWMNEEYVVDTLLPEVRQALIYGQVHEGTLGETVAITTLLMVMDKARGNRDWVTMEEFFATLCGSDPSVPLDPKIASADICVNHFLRWYKDMNKADLETLAKRRAACILQQNQHGTDLVIPFVISNSKKRNRDDHVAESSQRVDEFGMVIIQVKDCKAHEDMREVGFKLADECIYGEQARELSQVKKVKVVMEIGLKRNNNSPNNISLSQPKTQLVKVERTKVNTGRKEGIAVKASTSTSQELFYPSNVSRLPEESKFEFVRLKGLDSISFLSGKDRLKNRLNELLRGPICPSDWWESYRNHGWTNEITQAPEYRFYVGKMCIGDQGDSVSDSADTEA